MSEERILDALRALAEADAGLQASPDTESVVLQQFKKRRGARGRLRAGAWLALGTLAAAAAITAFMAASRPPVLHSQAPAVAASAPVEPATAVAPKIAPAHSRPKPKAVAVAPAQPAPQEVVTDFFPLMDPAPPFDRGQLLRVQLPAAALRTVGLPVLEEHLADPIQADVLVGEEGMPRAIRFIRFTQ
jgi:hypothetical protein